tara:strand:- start:372 stop:503 length:132 start_codon:yes stop_codon:yes gene_type:complete
MYRSNQIIHRDFFKSIYAEKWNKKSPKIVEIRIFETGDSFSSP